MKYRYKLISHAYIYEDDLLADLHKMSKKGYSLKKVGYFFFKFEKDSHLYKYQFDYQKPNQDYLETIKDIGYEYLGQSRNLYVYRHHDINAVNLHTDERMHRLLLLDNYGLPLQIALLTIAIIGFININMSRHFVQWNTIDFYVHYQSYYQIILTFVFSMTCLSICCPSFLLDKIQENAHKNYIPLRRFCNLLEQIFFVLTLIVGVFVPILNLRMPYLMIDIILIILGIIIYKAFSHHFQKAYQFALILLLGCFFLPQGLNEIQLNNLLPVKEYYSYEDDKDIIKESNPFILTYSISDTTHSYFEEKYLCQNEKIKDNLIKNLLIKTQQEVRMQNEFNQIHSQSLNINELTTPLPYQEVLQKFKKQTFNNVNYYQLDNIIIAYQDQVVVRYGIEKDDDILKIIQFNFKKGES